MCSIIGYSGGADAAPILVRGLRRMEYRGYDSVGVATTGGGGIEVRKGTGRVGEVNARLSLDALPGSTGIGHTRWATHGGVTDANAHPHRSNSGGVALVHNGILDNFGELKAELESEGCSFRSETDTEVLANLLQREYDAAGGAREAVLRTVARLRGHYAFVAMFGDGTLVAARFREPLIIGVGDGQAFLSSDVLGFIEYTNDAIYLENGNAAVIEGGKPQVFDFGGAEIRYGVTKVSREFGDAYKGEYAHFTLKEIHEQPDTVTRAGEGSDAGMAAAAEWIRGAGHVYITGSGSSYNAALVAKQLLSRHAGIKSEPVIASEMRFAPEISGDGSVLIAISQSGESADVLEAVRIAKEAGCRVVAIVNLLTSSLVREADAVVGMNCGPEVGVASTKSFTSQLAVIHRIIGRLGGQAADFGSVSRSMGRILGDPAGIAEVAGMLKDASDAYILGRGVHYPIALEASLKIKELTYVHAEGLAGGELKHGPLALMDENVFVIVINPDDTTREDMLTSAREIKSRGAKIIGVSDVRSDVYDHWIEIPAGPESEYPMTEIVPIQLLAYYLALARDRDPDYPRNLAKSVTVR